MYKLPNAQSNDLLSAPDVMYVSVTRFARVLELEWAVSTCSPLSLKRLCQRSTIHPCSPKRDCPKLLQYHGTGRATKSIRQCLEGLDLWFCNRLPGPTPHGRVQLHRFLPDPA
jgi:hypothetical protein